MGMSRDTFMRNLVWLICCALLSAALPARELEDFRALRASDADEAAEEPHKRPVSDRDFGFGLHVELRPLNNPNGFFFGFGGEVLIRFHERMWISTAATIFGGSAQAVSYSRFSFGKNRQHGAAGLELRPLLRYDFGWWPKGGMYALLGASTGYFYGTGGGNRARHTWSAGPSLLLGFEAGKRVRVGFESGATVYFALNRKNAGWYAAIPDSGPAGTHITLFRFSLRWFG